jgi:hypothetical protein
LTIARMCISMAALSPGSAMVVHMPGGDRTERSVSASSTTRF